ncbi:MAG: hypothetical protein SGILL_006541 [Bacillariaceae sp.]
MAPSKFAGIAKKAVAQEKENNGTATTAVTPSKAAPSKAATSPKKGSPKKGATAVVVANGSPAKAPALTADQRKAAANANWDKVTGATKVATAVAKNQRAAAGQKMFARKLISAVTWEMFSPPPTNSLKGKIVPRVLNQYKHRRRISVEVHKVTPLMEGDDKEKAHSYEECVVRTLVPASKELSRKFKREAFVKLANHEGSAEEFGGSAGFLKENGFHDDDDDASVSDESVSSAERGDLADHGGKEYEGWKPKYR